MAKREEQKLRKFLDSREFKEYFDNVYVRKKFFDMFVTFINIIGEMFDGNKEWDTLLSKWIKEYGKQIKDLFNILYREVEIEYK